MARPKKNSGNGTAAPASGPQEIPVADFEHTRAQINNLTASLMSNNVSDERMQQFERDWNAARAAEKVAADARKAIEKTAEGDGINIRIAKVVIKEKAKQAPEARHNLQTMLRYTRQLGLFAAIEAHEQDEANEANGASVSAAETQKNRGPMAPGDAAKLKESIADDQPVTGGTLDAIKAQGYQAGLDGAVRDTNPWKDKPGKVKELAAWDDGHRDGALKRAEGVGEQQNAA